MGSTPITLVAAQGSGTFIQPLYVFFRMNYLTAPYATNTQLRIKVGTLDPLASISNVLDASATTYLRSSVATLAGSTGTGMLNTDCTIYVTGGNPTGGSGTLDVYLTYSVITL